MLAGQLGVAMTDARVREALARAADLCEAFGTKGATYLAGWAEAVEALDSIHLGASRTGAARCKHCKRGWCPARTAITEFCDAMPGERDG